MCLRLGMVGSPVKRVPALTGTKLFRIPARGRDAQGLSGSLVVIVRLDVAEGDHRLLDVVLGRGEVVILD
jgi:hypothetical protein